MTDNRASKADVQTTPLNRMPVPGEDDVEFSAEEAAEAFERQNDSDGQIAERQDESE
ncbi:hypothetical protein [Cohnella hongkongensis]|uniref:YfhD family protein n=1 Tax=Cohnella hongkongensis TaxID=178337 RepID=A0ABV9F8D7_9BACL